MKPWIIVDGHCDTITVLDEQRRSLGERSNTGQLDLPRLVDGGVNVQFFAIFISPKFREMALKKCLYFIDKMYLEIEKNKKFINLVWGKDDIERIVGESKCAALLTVEGGDVLTGDIAVLRTLYRLGVRSLTLTWNNRNDIGDGVGEGESGGGLSLFGKSVVKEMNSLGMLIDVSHLSEKGFWDVANESSLPFAATHSNCRSVCYHPRNLTDDQIDYLTKTGGIIGLTFVPEFIDERLPGLDALLCHMDYIASKFGTDSIALGSDFDGMEKGARGLQDVTCLKSLAGRLISRGYSDEEVSGIMGGNWLRLLANVLK